MELTDYRKFTISDLAQLRSELKRLDVDVPVVDDVSVLATPFAIGDRQIPNRLCVQPMEGCDAHPDGSPSPLTYRRYTRYAEGGSGLIWMEATAITPAVRSNPSQLCLHTETLPAFTQLVSSVREAAAQRGHDPVIILQLAHPGRNCAPPMLVHHNPVLDADSGIPATYPLVTDEELEAIRDSFIAAARLAAAAGFDGVDIKTCHNDLLGELLGARTREGAYGGSFENRTRLLLAILTAVREHEPALWLTTRTSVYDANAYPYGFGVDREDPKRADLDEPRQLAGLLANAGVCIINVSPTGPRKDPSNSSGSPRADADLREVARRISLTRAIQNAVPGTAVMGGDISWFRQFSAHVAAGIIDSNGAALVGLGRLALAYPDAAADILSKQELVPGKTCMLCGVCIKLIRSGRTAGCVIRDREVYGGTYRHQRQFDLDHLRDEATRCHDCENAPCSAACPARIDVPAFIKAYERDDIAGAYAILDQQNILPEMCSHLCPGWLLCEGACIENTLTGNPVPIRDIQYVVSWLAREEIDIGIGVPENESGKHIAIVGAGPAGLSAAARLVAAGHRVTLYESKMHLGGTPEATIPGSRYPGAQGEIAARLQPALDSGRIVINYGQALGSDLDLSELRTTHDAVLLAMGLGQERRLSGQRPEGVIDALSFLAGVRAGSIISMPKRVAILSGGDCAMDAARQAKSLGANELFIVYGGARGEMHWHMEEAWTASEGVHLMTQTEPVGYTAGTDGTLTGLTCRHNAFMPGTELTLPVDLVIEAMGLTISDAVKQAIAGVSGTRQGLIATQVETPFATDIDGVFAVGALINGGASVAQCIAEGMQAAETINASLATG